MNAAPDKPAHYELRLNGHIDTDWAEWFEGLTSSTQADGTTLVSGLLADQAALHGLIRRVGDLGISLISVNLVPAGATVTQTPEAR